MRLRNISHLSVFVLVVFATSFATTVSGQITNPSFEDGLTGWTTTGLLDGAVISVTSTPDDLFPSDRNSYLVIGNGTTGPASAGHGPHDGDVAQVGQNFLRPAGPRCTLTVDWDFALGENANQSFYLDILSIDVIDPSDDSLVANVVFIDSGAGTSDSYTNVPGASALEVPWVPQQMRLAPEIGLAGVSPAPAGYKRAYVDLSSSTMPGATYRIEITVGNNNDIDVPSVAYIDNILLSAGQGNSDEARLRVLGAAHFDGTCTYYDCDSSDAGVYEEGAPYRMDAAPGQRIALRLAGTAGAPLVLAVGTINRSGMVVPGLGTVNLALLESQVVLNGLNPADPLASLLGRIPADSYPTLFIEGALPRDIGDSRIAVQAGMVDATNPPFNFRLAAATEIVVAAPKIPLGDTEVVDSNGSPLGDDDERQVLLPGFAFPFYGTFYSDLYVVSNGYLTFDGGGATDYDADPGEFLSLAPRISPFQSDFNPGGESGTISTRIDATTATVSWFDLGSYDSYGGAGNTFSVQLYANGIVTMYFASTTAIRALVGISPGGLSSTPATSSSPVDISDLTSGARQNLPVGEAIWQAFTAEPDYHTDGTTADRQDIMTIGRDGPARITFVPDGMDGYTWFIGTR